MVEGLPGAGGLASQAITETCLNKLEQITLSGPWIILTNRNSLESSER
jgi:hypothetical protein